jgi:uncharacterized protein YdaU (DUF1376 family)
MTLPYYPRYTKNFLEATAGWPLELKGAYGVLLDLIYHHGGELPDDPHFIAGNLGCSVRKWNTLRSQLLEKQKIISRLSKDNLQIISNKRADKEAEKLRRYEEKQRQNGSKAHENKDLGYASADAKMEAVGHAKDNPTHQPARAPLDLDSDIDRKEEEDARELSSISKENEPGLLADIREALGVVQGHSPYWSDATLAAHVAVWKADGLTDERIIEEAKASRIKNPEPPDGPKALDRWMATAANAARNTPTHRPARPQAAAKATAWTPEDRLKFYADWVNGDKPLPPSSINNTLAHSLLDAGLVSIDRLKKRGIAA